MIVIVVGNNADGLFRVIHGVRDRRSVQQLAFDGHLIVERIGFVRIFRNRRAERVLVEEAIEHTEVFVKFSRRLLRALSRAFRRAFLRSGGEHRVRSRNPAREEFRRRHCADAVRVARAHLHRCSFAADPAVPAETARTAAVPAASRKRCKRSTRQSRRNK